MSPLVPPDRVSRRWGIDAFGDVGLAVIIVLLFPFVLLLLGAPFVLLGYGAVALYHLL